MAHSDAIEVGSGLSSGDDAEIVITVYRPEPALWEPDFKRKRP